VGRNDDQQSLETSDRFFVLVFRTVAAKFSSAVREPAGKMPDIVSRGRNFSVAERNAATSRLGCRTGAMVAVVTVALFVWSDVNTCGAASLLPAGACTVE